MESEVKTRTNFNPSTASDPVARVLKFESDHPSPRSSVEHSPINAHKKKGSKINQILNKENDDDKMISVKQEAGSFSPKNSLLKTPTRGNKSMLEGETSKGTLTTNVLDSPFTSYCKMLDMPSASKNPRGDNNRTEAFRLSGLKDFLNVSPLKGSAFLDSATTTPFKKNVTRLVLKNRLATIRSNRDDRNVHVDIDYKDDDHRSFESPMRMTDMKEEMNFSDFPFVMNRSIYSANSMVPMQRSFSFQPEHQTKEEIFQAAPSTMFEMSFKNEDFSRVKFEAQEYEAPMTPTLYQDSKRIVCLDSVNSFSGKKSHEERKRQKNEITFGTNNNTNSSTDSFMKLAMEGKEGQDQKEVKKKLSCNCKKSMCLKLYCDCFAAGDTCSKDCNCANCHNTPEYEEERKAAIESTLEKNPEAFKPKVDAIKGQAKAEQGATSTNNVRHLKGCNCKKSGCLKKYCECYQAGIKCTEHCKCENCKNIDQCALVKRAQSFVHSGAQDMVGMKRKLFQDGDDYGQDYYSKSRYTDEYGRLRMIPQDENEGDSEEEAAKASEFPKKRMKKVGEYNTWKTEPWDSLPIRNPVSGKNTKMEIEEPGLRIKKEEISIKKEEGDHGGNQTKRKKADKNADMGNYATNGSRSPTRAVGGGRKKKN